MRVQQVVSVCVVNGRMDGPTWCCWKRFWQAAYRAACEASGSMRCIDSWLWTEHCSLDCSRRLFEKHSR